MPGVSPSGARVSFAGLAGAPETVRKAMSDAMTAEVAARKLTLANPENAHYLIRGNMSVYPAGKGTEVAWVWDVYDAKKQFRHRLTDSLTIPATAGDGWSLVTAQHIANIASRSIRDISAYLTHTPEAISASGKPAKALSRTSGRPVQVSVSGANTGVDSPAAADNRAGPALGYAAVR